jgi:large subunit ribosomal protein L30
VQLHQPVILKNVPSVNKLLAEVKHLVRILPLRFPHGIPEHESDFEHVTIRSNGELVVKKRLKEFEPPTLTANESLAENDKWKLEQSTVIKDLEKRLASFTVQTEYFKTKYIYRHNQDGKEYRYTFNKDVPKYEW